ncbi:hypothetical protein [Thermococcus sp.]
MSVHVALLGRSPWALVNTFYASVMRGERPEEIYVVTEERDSKNLLKVRKAIETISNAYGFSCGINSIVIPDNDFREAERVLKKLFSELESRGERIVLNITSGRKALVAAAIIHSMDSNVEGVLYLALLDDRFPNRPYMMIPKHLQVLKNFLGGE